MLDALISAGANLLSGAFNRNSQSEHNAQQAALARENLAFQREAATSGIQWKVADAQKAGIHPLAALGANTFSPSPVSMGGEAPKFDFGSVGQDLGRAAKAMQGAEMRKEVDEEQARRLTLEKGRLENDILRAELNSKVARSGPRSAQIGPPMPNSAVTPDRIPLPRPGPERTVSGEAVKDDDIKQKFEDFPATKWARPFGYGVMANPYFGDGQSFEDRYGDSEIGSTLKWGVNTLADHVYTAQKYWIPEAYKNYDRRWLYNRFRR